MKSFSTLALALGTLCFSGCGGGGGDGGDVSAALPPTVAITSSNQGAVAAAAIDGGQAVGSSQILADNDRATAQSASATPSALRVGAVQGLVRRGLETALVQRRSAGILSAARPAATTSSTVACAVSGSVTTSVNDADSSQTLSGGDVFSITFNQCKDSAADLVSGALVFSIGSVTSAVQNNVQFSGTVAFQQVAALSGGSSATVNGSVGVAAAITSTSFQMSLTIGTGGLTVTSTGPGYNDSIVYDPGMQLAVNANEGTSPSTTVTLNGSFSASAIGGRVTVTTVQPVVTLGSDAHPSSGQVVVTGASGTHLRITAVSSTQVQLDLDANGDGTYESFVVVTWGSLATM
jgi:hypothetical protein